MCTNAPSPYLNLKLDYEKSKCDFENYVCWVSMFFFCKKTLMVRYLVNYGVWGGMGWVSHFGSIKTSIKHIYLKNYDQPIGNYTPCSLYSIQYDINQETAMSPRPTLQQRSPNFTQMLKLIHPHNS